MYTAESIARFWSRVNRGQPDACWPWGRLRNPQTYGRATMQFDNGTPPRRLFAHRTAYELAVGPIPEGLCVCHHCDQPYCCNPAHLFLGTHQDNVDDMRAKGGVSKSFGTDNPASKLSETQAQVIRRHHERGVSVADLSALFEVKPATVRKIIRGETWTR